MALDAIVRALYRMTVSRRHLLQWTTAAAAQAPATTDLAGAAAPALAPSRWSRCCCWRRCWPLGTPHPALAHRAVPAVGRLAAVDLVGQPAAAGARATTRCRPHDQRLPGRHRARHLALLRALRRRRGQPPAARQPADRAARHGGAPHLAHQHRPVPAERGLRARSSAGSARRSCWRGWRPRWPRWRTLQRHRGHFLNWYDTQTLRAAAADVRVHRRQRQPERPPAGAGPGLPGAGRARLSTRMRRQRRAGGFAAATATAAGRAPQPVARSTCRDCAGAWPTTEPRVASAALDRQALALPTPATRAPWTRRGRAAARAGAGLPSSWPGQADFGFLYHRKRHLFHIGYRVAEQQLDAGFYDLLASESRLTSLLAIAKGDVPVQPLGLARPAVLRGRRAAPACARGRARCSST